MVRQATPSLRNRKLYSHLRREKHAWLVHSFLSLLTLVLKCLIFLYACQRQPSSFKTKHLSDRLEYSMPTIFWLVEYPYCRESILAITGSNRKIGTVPALDCIGLSMHVNSDHGHDVHFGLPAEWLPLGRSKPKADVMSDHGCR